MVASTRSTSAIAALMAILLSTTALAAVPEDAGVALSVEPRAAPPEVRPLAASTIKGQRFAAEDGRVLELLLADGTSLTLAAGGALTIEEFAFDPEAMTDRLHVSLEQGLLRVGGGRPAFAEPVVVTTPAGEAELVRGGGLVFVGPDGTTRTGLLFGGPLTMTAAGSTEQVVRPGFETVTTRGAAPESAERRPEGQIAVDMAALNPGLLAALAPGAGEEAPGAEEEATAADDTLENVQDNLSQTTAQVAQPAAAGPGGLNAAGGFAPSLVIAPSLTQTQPSITATPDLVPIKDGRQSSLRSNSIFLSDEPFAQTVGKDSSGAIEPTPLHAPDAAAKGSTDLDYFFVSTSGASGRERFLEFLELSAQSGDDLASGTSSGLQFEAPFALDSIPIIEGTTDFNSFDNRKFVQGEVREDFQGAATGDETGIGSGTIFGVTDDPDAPRIDTFVSMLQTGLSLKVEQDEDSDGIFFRESVERSKDHFLLIEVRPILTTAESRQTLQNQLEDPETNKTNLLRSSFDIELEPSQDANAVAAALASILRGPGSLQDRIRSLSILTDTQKQRAVAQANRSEQFLFASGAVDGELDSGRRLDTFFVSQGLEGFNETTGKPPANATVAAQIRAFLRNATAFRNNDGTGGLPLADTGLLVIGAPAHSQRADLGQPAGSNEQTGVLHADFGIAGEGSDQQSTISTTVGEVTYGVKKGFRDLDDPGANEVVLEARTVGSSRETATEGSVLASTDLFNTAAGGGNDAVEGQNGESRAGYFVIENFDPEDFAKDPDSTGGLERPLTTSPTTDGTQQQQQFAVLRLATGIRSEVPTNLDLPDPGATFKVLKGYAAGLGEAQAAGNGANPPSSLAAIAVETGTEPEGFILKVNPTTNRVEAVYELVGFSNPLQMGGLTGDQSRGQSAYVDQDRFGARTAGGNGADAAMVSGELLRQAADAPGSTANADTKAFLNAMPQSKDLKWGFFFGDLEANNGGLRRHVHLGTWVAGKVPDGSRLPESGTARYEGGAIGNVVNGGALYSATGTYASTWNFGSRAGLTELDFDGAKMTGFTQQKGSKAVFAGGLSGKGRTAGIAGSFVQGAERSGVAPGGQMGRFTVSGNNYGAAGTFGALKK